MRLWVWAAWAAATALGGCDKGEAAIPQDAVNPAATMNPTPPTTTTTTTTTSPPTPTSTSTPPSQGTRIGPEGGGGGCDDDSAQDCPLRKWMKHHSAPAVRSFDIETLAATFDTIAGFAPATPDYPNWKSIAHDGAAAARAASMEGVKASCRGCHDQYKALYKAQLRARPLP